MTFWRRLLAFLGFRRTARWEDGVVVTGAALDRYRALYDDTVAWVLAVQPNAVQAPDFRVTVRLYTIWPVSDGLTHYGKVLAPNVIQGDHYGTLCLYHSKLYPNDTIIRHGMLHCVTGISDHPAWLFPGYHG